jgi:hypothetical protein
MQSLPVSNISASTAMRRFRWLWLGLAIAIVLSVAVVAVILRRLGSSVPADLEYSTSRQSAAGCTSPAMCLDTTPPGWSGRSQ